MLCQLCGERVGVVELTTVKGGRMTKSSICPRCAGAGGAWPPLAYRIPEGLLPPVPGTPAQLAALAARIPEAEAEGDSDTLGYLAWLLRAQVRQVAPQDVPSDVREFLVRRGSPPGV